MAAEIVSTRRRPGLAKVTGRWRSLEFFSRTGRTLETILEAEREGARAVGTLPLTLVLLADGEPVGMSSLAARDLDQRPDLSPWLAGVYVVADHRGRGHATRLVAAVEDAARQGSFGAIWLYTRTAESLHRRCGWRVAEPFERGGRTYALMRRDLVAPASEALR